MVINGKEIAFEKERLLAVRVSAYARSPRLTAILIGHAPALTKFVDLKEKAAARVGIDFETHIFEEGTPETEIKTALIEIAQGVDGLLVELPLPAIYSEEKIADTIPLEKDVDVLSATAQNAFYKNALKILPPTVEALKIVLEKYQIDIRGKNIAVFGQGNLVGKPIAHWLERRGATVLRIDEFTKNSKTSRNADIVITGVGKPHFIKHDMIQEGAIVIDYGYENKDGSMVGDVDPAVAEKASLFTPVPGGMGPITIVAMLGNLISLYDKSLALQFNT